MTDHRVYPDPVALGAAVAAEIADGIAAAAAAGRDYLLGCPSGRSPRSTLAALADEVRRRRLPLGGLVVVLMDEYLVPSAGGWQPAPPQAHYSCRGFGLREILRPLAAAAADSGPPEDNLWVPDPADPLAVERRVLAAGGIDLFLLASGAGDGHVAFNPPGTDRAARTRVVALAEQTRRDNLGTFPGFGSLAQVPTHGVGVGPATLADLPRRVIMLLTGPGKATAHRRITGTDRYDPDWPASIVHECRRPLIVADEAAAGAAG